MKKCFTFIAVVMAVSTLYAGTPEWYPVGHGTTMIEEPFISTMSQDTSKISCEVNLAGILIEEEYTKGGTLKKISLPNQAFREHIGQAKLPVVRILVEVPHGSTLQVGMKRQVFDEYALTDFGINDIIVPVQDPIEKTPDGFDKWQFKKNEEYYAHDDFKPQQLVSVESITFYRAHRVARIDICPVTYNPKQGLVRIYHSVGFELKMNGGNDVQTVREISRTWSDSFEQNYSNMIINYGLWRNLVRIGSDRTSHWDGILIISATEFYAKAEELAAWRRKSGYFVEHVDITTTGATVESIKNYIQNAYSTWSNPALSFVLLVGDTPQIPTPSGTSCSGCASDSDYACVSGTDNVHDIYVGRISVETLTQATNVFNRLLTFAKAEFVQDGWIKKATFLSSCDPSYNSYHTHEFCQANYTLPNGYTGTYYPGGTDPGGDLIRCIEDYGSSGSASGADAVNALNEGRSLYVYSGHGSYTSWGGPSVTQGNLQNATCGEMTPFMVGHCCIAHNIKYSTTCFGEACLREVAVGYYGSSESSYWGEDDYLQRAWFAKIFTDNQLRMGEFTTNGLIDMYNNYAASDYYMDMEILGADPAMEIYTEIPLALSGHHDTAISVGQSSFTVVVNRGGLPLAGARVCLIKTDNGDDLKEFGITNASGTVTLTMNPAPGAVGKLDITVTAMNSKPYENLVDVIVPAGPWLTFEQADLDDSTGNNDGIANPGETISMEVTLENIGADPGSSISATISESSGFITITDSTASFPPIPVGGTGVSFANHYSFQVAESTPDGQTLNFMLNWTADVPTKGQYSGDTSWSITVASPELTRNSITLTDTCGTGGDGHLNNVLEPGETGDISVALKNLGSSIASNIQAILSTQTNGISVVNNQTAYPDIASGGLGEAQTPFVVYIDESVTCVTEVHFDFEITSNQGTWSSNFTLNVGQVGGMVELFSEDFSTWPPDNWIIVDGGASSHTWQQSPSENSDSAQLPDDFFALVDSDEAGTIDMDEALISPVIDCSNYTNVWLEFDHYFNYYEFGNNEVGDVDISIDGGTSWQTVLSYTSDSSNPEHVSQDISSYAAEQAQVQIRFHYYNASYEWIWAVDNVSLVIESDPLCNICSCPIPGPVELLSPSNGAQNTETDISLDWQDSVQADTYKLYFGTASPPPLFDSGLTESTISLNNLVSGETYFWYVTAINNCGTTTSTTRSFTTASPCLVPEAFSLTAPADGAVDQPEDGTLDWGSSNLADTYNVYFSMTNPPSLYESDVVPTSINVSSLNQGATYYWYVEAVNVCGSTTSTTWSFTTSAPCPVPGAFNLVTPANGAIDQPVDATLDWGTSSLAETYNVYFSTTNPPTLYESDVIPTSTSVSGLNQGTTYYWYVEAVNSCGSTITAIWSFTTTSPCPPPGACNLVTPVNGAIDQPVDVTLDWGTSSLADMYNVYFSTTNPPALYESDVIPTNTNVSGLNQGTTYYWYVEAVNSCGSTTTAIWSFTTTSPCPIPGNFNLLTPVNGATDQPLNVVLTWETSNLADTYNVYLSSTTPASLYESGLVTTSLNLSELDNETTYYWSVEAVNTCGTTSSQEWSFATQASSAPVNDDFDSAIVIGNMPFNYNQDTSTASTSGDDPNIEVGPFSGQGHNSVWYQFSPPDNGILTMNTFGSSYDTILSVWIGPRGNLEMRACNDNSDGGMQSQLQTPLLTGFTYCIEIVGTERDAKGTLQIEADFTSPMFVDVPVGHWAKRFVEAIYYAQITSGCSSSPMKFCPGNPVLRAHMAVFLEKAIHGAGFQPPAPAGVFDDVPPDHWAAAWIEAFYDDGITNGCGQNPLRYCPDAEITREQMAIFLLRAKYGDGYVPPAPTGTLFQDVPEDYWAASWIEQLAIEGITSGCGSGMFCPGHSVTREQLAIFIVRTFDLTVSL